MNLYYELTTGCAPGPLPATLGVTDADVLTLLSARIAIGLWRSELDTGHMYFSRQTCRIFGLEETQAPVNLTSASHALHPEDAPVALELLEMASREKGSYQAILRVLDAGQRYKFVRIVGRYRSRADGVGEIIGICHDLPDEEPQP
mgnify:CR=1 FL=1